MTDGSETIESGGLKISSGGSSREQSKTGICVSDAVFTDRMPSVALAVGAFDASFLFVVFIAENSCISPPDPFRRHLFSLTVAPFFSRLPDFGEKSGKMARIWKGMASFSPQNIFFDFFNEEMPFFSFYPVSGLYCPKTGIRQDVLKRKPSFGVA